MHFETRYILHGVIILYYVHNETTMHRAGEFIMIFTDVDHIIWILILNV